jgi:hypothetical protein
VHYAPRIITIKIPVEKIRERIGSGGKTIRSIVERTGVKVDVEDDGCINIASSERCVEDGEPGRAKPRQSLPLLPSHAVRIRPRAIGGSS